MISHYLEDLPRAAMTGRGTDLLMGGREESDKTSANSHISSILVGWLAQWWTNLKDLARIIADGATAEQRGTKNAEGLSLTDHHSM